MPSEYHCPLSEDECITVRAGILEERKEQIGRFSVLYANYYDLPTDGLRHRQYFDNAYYELEYAGQHYAPDAEIPYNPDGTLAFVRSESYYLYVYSADGGGLIDTISSSAYRIGSIWDSSLGQANYFWVNLLPVIEWQSITQEAEDIYRWETYKINKADHLPNAILKQLQVTECAYNFLIGYVDPLNPFVEIPRHCWNIYMVTYPLNIAGIITTDDVELVMQICTDDPGTFERPILEVTCDCGESCPENTCPVECTDHVCCYSSDGISLKEIPLTNYNG